MPKFIDGDLVVVRYSPNFPFLIGRTGVVVGLTDASTYSVDFTSLGNFMISEIQLEKLNEQKISQ